MVVYDAKLDSTRAPVSTEVDIKLSAFGFTFEYKGREFELALTADELQKLINHIGKGA